MNKNKSEKSQIYCSFFNNVGSCMHGEACSKIHVRPNISKTILLANIYPNPLKFISMLPEQTLIIEPATLARNFDEFYIDLYEELRMYGPIEDLLVAGNLCDHLVGNVLVRFVDELDAVNALEDLRHRFYAGRPIDAQFSPVENLQESTCKQYFTNECKHGENCNFIHPMYPSDYVLKECQLAQIKNDNYSSANDREHGDDRRRSRGKDRNYEFDKDSDRRREKHDSRKLRDDSPSRDRNYDKRYRNESPPRDRSERNYRNSDRDDRNYRNSDRDDKNYRSSRDDRNDRSYRSSDRDDRGDRDRGSRDRNDDRDRSSRNDRDRGRGRNDRERGSRDRNDDRDRDYRADRDRGNRDRSYRNSDRERGGRDKDRDGSNDKDGGNSRDFEEAPSSATTFGYTRTRGTHNNHF